ncbi:MAG: DUF3043 domain-containing protein [Propionibacteriaceae bacterium]|jgi:cation transport ATPase|nr:DUF3043 domain-containing protein [Propionibacteriaceae bacterium]
MGLFESYEQQSKPATKPSKSRMTAVIPVSQSDATGATDVSDNSQKKNRPTPSRKESQAARMEAMHPKLTKKEQQRRETQAQAKRNALREQLHESEPERAMMRNYVDSRWSLTEFMLPIMIVLLAASLLGSAWPLLVMASTGTLWALMLACLVNIFIFWRGFKDELWERYPGVRTKGLLSGMISRMVAMRRFRMPGVAVERGGTY